MNWRVRCQRCGNFTLTEDALSLQDLKDEDKYKLSAWTREKTESGQPVPCISADNLRAIISSFPDYGVADKQRLLLQFLAEISTYPGKFVTLDYLTLWPRIWASGRKEIKYLADALDERGLIEIKPNPEGPIDTCQITPKGWDFLDNVKREISESGQAFVAMWFDRTMDEVWTNGIKPAIGATGYKAYRVDNDKSNIGRIDAKIEAEIKRSQFLIADVTGGNQGVYYEAGFAMGLGIPVIWCVRKDRKDDMHFDTKQYKHIIWSNPEDLAKDLEDLIIAAIGRNVVNQPTHED